MACPVCHHEWYWVCGLDPNNIFHEIQLDGSLCSFINNITFGHGSIRLHWSIRWLFTIVLFATLPVIMYFVIAILIGLTIDSELCNYNTLICFIFRADSFNRFIKRLLQFL